ncbi:SUF system Fe-S cluster assembly regulator [Nevskia ramosa]|uniref:SUF system Fe-S cluster assembly regulator n=1 Tax=Nevskia ramosa TaxID=64002 RepID=UPI0023551A3F|nr:SUF system Fe-S cluster assembly regulator [Nevskia ramosa]
MLKIAKLTDYGTLVMTTLALEPATCLNAQELAARSHVAAPTVAKLLKLLVKGGLVASTRGTHGGYRLARGAETITVADVVSALEGPIAITACAQHGGGCTIEGSCTSRSNWRLIDEAVRQALSAVTLAQMAAPRAQIHSARLHGKTVPLHAVAARE